MLKQCPKHLNHVAPMMEVWTGTITTDNSSVNFRGSCRIVQGGVWLITSCSDVCLWSNSPYSHNHVLQDTKLHYLSLVHVASIPLYLAAGPSLQLSSENEATTQWLSDELLSQGDISGQDGGMSTASWVYHGAQSDYGILLRVEYGEGTQPAENNITELLLYATTKSDFANLPTRAPSSMLVSTGGSPTEPCNGGCLNVNVSALPLCSKIFDRIDNASELKSTHNLSTTPGEAIFLPQNGYQRQNPLGTHQKRQSLSYLFDNAEQKRRKLKSRGGERISKAMANVDHAASRGDPRPGLALEVVETPPIRHKGDSTRRSLSRASSMMSITSSELPRPASRSGTLHGGKRSSLHRVESATSPHDSPMLTDVESDIAQQNKAALTRVTMAGMRLHGLQPKKRSAKPLSVGDRPNTATFTREVTPSEVEDEFKLVYHQTFKASLFAFRKSFNVAAISQDLMRDVVDTFLNMFCCDPLVRNNGKDEGSITFGMSNQKSTTAFDEPSMRHSSMLGRFSSPPIVKKR